MKKEDFEAILSRVEYPGYTLFVKQDGDGLYMQGSYSEPDCYTKEEAIQKTRKWRLSIHMTPSEVTQTALKLLLTSAEHRVREHFLYRGERVYGPHFDVEELVALAKARKLDTRPS